MRSQNRLLFLASLVALSACGPTDSATGYVWQVELTGIADTCNAAAQGYQETFDYVIYYDGALADLRVDGESFATGTFEGCNLSYSSPVMGEQREDGAWVKWILEGEATFRPGGTSCDLDPGVDWSGEEVFTIKDSEDKDIEVGCTYTLSAVGVYQGKDE